MKSALKAIAMIAAMLPFWSTASAQTTNTITTQSAPNVTPVQTPPLQQTVPPAKTGPGIGCAGLYYPALAVRLSLEGTVTVGFTVTAQGAVTNVGIISSSGSSVLDDASVACVSQFQYKPATRNGQPIEVPWKVVINWALHGGPRSTGSPHICPASLLPADGSIKPNGETTIAYFHIAADGSVRDIVVGRSSGSEPLDQLVIRCISQWRYEPTMRAGQPTEILWGATIGIAINIVNPDPPAKRTQLAREIGSRDACRRPSSMEKPPSDTVVVLEVRTNGDAKNPRVWQSSGSNALDEFALSCTSALRFTPAYEDGRPIEVTIPVRIIW